MINGQHIRSFFADICQMVIDMSRLHGNYEYRLWYFLIGNRGICIYPRLAETRILPLFKS